MSEGLGERLPHGAGALRGFDSLAVYRVATYRRETTMSEQIEGDEGRTIAEPNDYDEGFPGLWVGHYAGDWDEAVEIQQFEEDDEISRNVFIQEEYLPEVIVALAERMPAEDVDHVIGQLEELEG